MLLPNSNPSGALLLAERLRAAVAATPFDLGTGAVAITISVGMSIAIEGGGDVLVRAADDAMYESKRLGRNRVTAAAQPVAVAT